MGSEHPEVQLVIGALGSLIKILKRTKIGAALFNRNLTASLFIGECTWEGDWGKVRVQRLVFNKLSDKEDTSEVPHCL